MGYLPGAKCISSFNVRVGTPDDIPAMVDLAVHKGFDRRAFTQACEAVLYEQYCFSLVVTCGSPEDRVVAFENAILLRPHLGQRIRCGGVPFSALLADGTERRVANEGEVGRANGDSGLDLFVVHHLLEDDLPPKDRERVMATMVAGFVDRYVGNHVRAVYFETKGIEAAKTASYGGWSTVATYEEWTARTGLDESQRPVLLRNDASNAIRHHNFLVARLMNYHPPILMLPPAAREVVRCAYLGWSDNRIIHDLGLTAASLNSRWTRILDTAERRAPEIFQGQGGRVRDRQRLLAYVKNHPEEMWPYDPQQKE